MNTCWIKFIIQGYTLDTYPKFHQNVIKTIISNSPYFDLLSNKIVLMIQNVVSLESIASGKYVAYIVQSK
jgi:hypothetical protein